MSTNVRCIDLEKEYRFTWFGSELSMSVSPTCSCLDSQAGVVDCLLAGLALMVGTCLYGGVRYGYLGRRIAACPSFHSGGGGGGWGLLRPLRALQSLQAVLCWILTTGDVVLGVRHSVPHPESQA